MVTAYLFGHLVFWHVHAQSWCYYDTGGLVVGSLPRRCPKCREFPTTEGHDPCLGTVRGVVGACCGHGVQEPDILTIEEHEQWKRKCVEGVR